jgi:uncharacterized protein (DUF736 family)
MSLLQETSRFAICSLGTNCPIRLTDREFEIWMVSQISLRSQVQTHASAVSPWLCLAGDGYASYPLAATVHPRVSSPAFHAFLAETRNPSFRRPPLCCGPKAHPKKYYFLGTPAGAAGKYPCLETAIEAAMSAGSTNSRRHIMANIGSFKKVGNDYQGEIVTMSVQTKNVRIVPEEAASENAPSHRVFVGRAEIGAAWTKCSNEGRDYLSLKLDDPSFTAPIFANLFDDEDGKTFNLIWSRARKTSSD